ncbi:MAG: TetR family transcriptional regulator C-terminal domain-containing protein, partial [Alphaproteobacteria bacterium]
NETIAKPRTAAVIAGAACVKAGIAAVFRNAADSVMEGGENRGCFLNNCAGEVAPHDALATKHLAAGIKHIEEAFYGALTMARDCGEIDPWREPRALARYLSASLNGLMVVGKVRPEREALDDIIGVTLAALD